MGPPVTGAGELPPRGEWSIPIHCFRCDGWFAVPFALYRAGMVFRCPHCRASLALTLPLVSAVRHLVETVDAELRGARERSVEAEGAAGEEEQRQALAALEARLRALVEREPLPGTPRPRRSAFAF